MSNLLLESVFIHQVVYNDATVIVPMTERRRIEMKKAVELRKLLLISRPSVTPINLSRVQDLNAPLCIHIFYV